MASFGWTVTAQNTNSGWVPLKNQDVGVVADVRGSTFGGGTVTFESTPDGGTTAVTLGTRTSVEGVGQETYTNVVGSHIRAQIGVATNPSLTVRMFWDDEKRV